MPQDIGTLVALVVTALVSMGATLLAMRWGGLWRAK